MNLRFTISDEYRHLKRRISIPTVSQTPTALMGIRSLVIFSFSGHQ